MPAPGYYQTNYRALRFREIVRMVGSRKAFWNYLATRFKRTDTPIWMPGLWADLECKQEDLSEYIWQATKPHRADFDKLGFTICRHSKITRSLNPNLRDTGGLIYLDSSRRYIGNLIYHRFYVPATGKIRNVITIAFTAVFEQDCLSCSNQKERFDPPAGTRVIRFDSYDVCFIYQQFLDHVQRHPGRPREFPTLESLRCWSDERQVKTFEERLGRRLFVPMTEEQVAAARGRLAAAPSPAGARRAAAMRSPILLLIFIATFVLLNVLHKPLRDSPGQLTYQGQQFKLAKPYASYEDYKDDPNNLDTNELDRIEQAMTAAKVPVSFKDRKAFLHSLFDLKFPGYGLGGIAAPKADDGSVLDVEAIEIPQRDKSRYLVLQESSGRCDLIDDFIAGTATNAITRAKLEAGTLRYYDEQGNLVRERKY